MMEWGRIGGLEDWRIGGLEDWRIGELESWRVGELESWRVGELEWGVGVGVGSGEWGVGSSGVMLGNRLGLGRTNELGCSRLRRFPVPNYHRW